MPRRYYRKRTTLKPKKKWASNIVIRNYTINSGTPQPIIPLVVNSAQAGTPTPVIVKAGNFKVNADIHVSVTGADTPTQFMAVVMYVPEGLSISNNAALGTLVAAHPEYIMAWRQFDTTSTSATAQQVNFSSRLKRNLNSGDSVVYGILWTDTGAAINNIHASVTVQYWTCAN